jgi:hypothetical protein
MTVLYSEPFVVVFHAINDEAMGQMTPTCKEEEGGGCECEEEGTAALLE